MSSKIKKNNKDEFFFNLKGRIQNLSLPPSYSNALIPLFEGISNSLHAIENKFPRRTSKSGEIIIEILRRNNEENAHPIGFKITDNGIGLTSENMESFRTSDSPYKKKRGGKGIGRLSWLKAFQKCSIISNFEENKQFWTRSFHFELDEKNPIKNYSLEKSPKIAPGTQVLLSPFVTEFEAYCPKKIDTVAAKIIGHFLPYFLVNTLPRILLKDIDEEIDVRDYYAKNQIKNDLVQFSVDIGSESIEFVMHHIILRKESRFLEHGGLHWIFYAGNDRVAYERAIDNQLGLKTLGEEKGIYVGLILSEFLDSRVNQERTAFSISSDIIEKIHGAAFNSTKQFLARFIDEIREQQLETTHKIIRENPQFLFLGSIENIIKNLPLNMHGEEDIFIELTRKKRRERQALKHNIAGLSAPDQIQDLEKEIERISKALNNESKGSLAEYVVRRKEILKFLEKALGFQSDGQHHYTENIIHNLIVPLRTNSEDLAYEEHNLWLLDDRLAFYRFFRSDQKLKKYTTSKSSHKPDLAFVFDPALAYEQEGTDEAIMIIEFKRPGRDDYKSTKNPVEQVLEYVEFFRNGGSIKNNKGKVIKSIKAETRFVCYIVADLTNSLRKVLSASLANIPTGDGRGYYGFSSKLNAQVEVIPYEKMLSDAKLRNEAFFHYLGISN